jgi:hypothetical protein
MLITISLSVITALASFAISARLNIIPRDGKSIYICSERNYDGECGVVVVPNGKCKNHNGWAMSIMQDQGDKARCELFAAPGCAGVMLPCSGDCPGLFIFENNLKSLRCFW